MKAYRVGGCVRDRLLGIAVHDIDWVVTGATPDEMLQAGYKPIGKDFPVFLHPTSKQEYALARSERKTGSGYRGFEINSDPSTSIEQDLLRRDLTINAMAEDDHGNIIDPFDGQKDIEARLLRHVSDAFIEDPVRVLRIARFAARFHNLGFKIAPETAELIHQMGQSKELDSLVAERVWIEMSRALDETNPEVFFQSLRDCQVLGDLFPQIDALYGVPQTARYHPEVDTGVHVMLALHKTVELNMDNEGRFAVLMHDLGKATTPNDILPSHHGHEKRGVKLVKAFCKQWRVPKAHTELALITTEYHSHVHRAFELKASTMLKFLSKVDVFRKPQRFQKMLDACLADARGRTNFEQDPYPQAAYLAALSEKLLAIELSPEQKHKLEGKAYGEAINKVRIETIKQHKQTLNQAAD